MEISFALVFLIVAVIFAVSAIRIVPQQSAFVVERLGRYSRTMEPGPHFIVPFVDQIRYKHSLKEFVLDIPEQICITKDNVSVAIDGVVFFRIVDPFKATYGINNYAQGLVQLAQTTLRSEIGKLDLDRSFEEREHINRAVVMAVENATEPWGVKILRYEIKSITPPRDVLEAMEKQMRAEREKRAKILESEADRDSKINRAEGFKQETIKTSEAEKIRQINTAEGEASAIFSVAKATADGLREISLALTQPGGDQAARLRMVEEYIKQFSAVASDARAVIVPANVSDPTSLLATITTAYDHLKVKG
ncbi:MAG: SPFH/Band 7/PHB domain protein [Bdellovibrionaceae bacterium]|nr:SPFH/Band 7/PHB domain protein [Pseudobdellovibrionaceae bacterium]